MNALGPWRSLLRERELRERAHAQAVDAAVALREPRSVELAIELMRLQSPLPRTVGWEPLAIGQGWAGLAVACGYLDACRPGEQWDETAHRYITLAAPSIQKPSTSVGLFSGLAGLGFAAHFLSKNGTRYRQLRHAIDDRLCKELEARGAQTEHARAGVPFGLFDLISGWTGVIAYLLERRDEPRLREHLMKLTERLVRLVLEGDERPAWYTPSSLCGDKTLAARYPEGILNCGLAHGIPGPLAVLSLALRDGVVVDGIQEAIGKVAQWLIDHRIEDDSGVSWPSVVPVGGASSDGAGRVAWCYGSPGVARALWLAGQATGEQSWCGLAIAAMEAVFRRPKEARGIFSPTFCHGLAGLLAITLRFAQATESPTLLDGVNALGHELTELHNPAAPLGFRSEDMPGVFVDRPGLLEGAPGVIITLLAASTDVEPTWDRLFMLS